MRRTVGESFRKIASELYRAIKLALLLPIVAPVVSAQLRILFPVPMDIGGDELEPGHSSLRVHVEDDTCWIIAKEILGVRLWK